MINAIKKINKALRVVFIGVVVLYGIVKIFDIVPKENRERIGDSEEHKTSEFDELW